MNYTLYINESAEATAKLSNYGDAITVAQLYINVDQAEIEIDFVNGWKWLRIVGNIGRVVIGMRSDDYIPESIVIRNRLPETQHVPMHVMTGMKNA